jgi:hypothetical protein
VSEVKSTRLPRRPKGKERHGPRHEVISGGIPELDARVVARRVRQKANFIGLVSRVEALPTTVVDDSELQHLSIDLHGNCGQLQIDQLDLD